MENTIKIGTTHVITSHKQHQFLVGRLMVITKGSKQAGYVNGHLYHEKLGTIQKSLIAIPMENLQEIYLPAIIPTPGKPTGQKVNTPKVIALPAPTKSKSKKIKTA